MSKDAPRVIADSGVPSSPDGLPDASLRVDESGLSEDEREFARLMGFGAEGSRGAPHEAEAHVDDRRARPAPSESEPGAEPEAAAADRPGPSGPVPAIEWEEVMPRPGAESLQDEIQERAELLARLETPLVPSDDPTDPVSLGRSDPQPDPLALQDAHEKALGALASEIDQLRLERDRLQGELEIRAGELRLAQDEIATLATSMRATRGAFVPLPDGERALRAEVLGLRSRLDETREENARLQAQIDGTATDLSIARAQLEDLRHEIDAAGLRDESLARALEDQRSALEEARSQRRESLAVCARLEAENDELRSIQAALEETLTARDLELTAREEHLGVIRQGLSARDDRLRELDDRLSQEQTRTQGLEGELRRRQTEQDRLRELLAQREARLASLGRKLARVEAAIGDPPDTERTPETTSSTRPEAADLETPGDPAIDQ